MPASREAEASALQATGSVASIAGRHEEAVDAFSAALGLRPDDATLLCDRSAALFALGRCEAALVDASRAVEFRPRWGEAHGQHGALLVALNCRKDAIAAYERATKCSAEESSAIMMQTELSRLRALEDEHNDGSTPTASSSDGATSGIPDTDALQAMGTEAFKAGDYLLAKDKWSAALLRRPDDATLLQPVRRVARARREAARPRRRDALRAKEPAVVQGLRASRRRIRRARSRRRVARRDAKASTSSRGRPS